MNPATLMDYSQIAAPPLSEGKAATGQASDLVVIDTKFGQIEFDRDFALNFPKGVPGFKGYNEFALARLPGHEDGNLLLLQSIEPSDLSFVVIGYDAAAKLITAEDIAEAQRYLGIAPEDCAMMLIVRFENRDGKVSMTVNLRAPLFLDTANRLAWQHILANESYQVRQPVEL
ncbi:MAG: flagellar assembly protein FliW [Pseudomonadota bacterium]